MVKIYNEYILIFIFAVLLALVAILTPMKAEGKGIGSSGIDNTVTDVRQALNKGLTWRTYPESKAKFMQNVYWTYNDFGAWQWEMRGMRPPILVAMRTWTESKGWAWSMADVLLGEIGLLSVKKDVAKKYDGNACNPELNLWMAQRSYHERYAQLVGLWPWLTNESMEQQLLIMDMAESAGIGATIYLVNAAACGSKPNAGKCHKDPYDKVVAFIKERPGKLINKYGDNAPKIAMRVGMVRSAMDKAMEAQHGKLCNDPALFILNMERPYDYPYPGDTMHRKCKHQQTEWQKDFPLKHEVKQWLKEMKDTGCWPKNFDYEG